MNRLEATFKVVTPLFLGGANPNECTELREPSIKAALRFWYRAIDPDYRGHEARIFGGTGKDEGQAMFLLRARGAREGKTPWDRNRYACFDAAGPKNGVQYLCYSLNLGDNKRKRINPGGEIELMLTFKQNPEPDDRRRIAAALWLFGHLGGLGSRSRRGLGTVSLRSYAIKDGGSWQELADLPPAHGASDVLAWIQSFEKGCAKIKQWFPTAPSSDHTVLNSKARFFLFSSGHSKTKRNRKEDGAPCPVTLYEPWEEALNVAGRAMQDYRQYWDKASATTNPISDYDRVKAHICDRDSRAAATVTGRSVTPLALSDTPRRVAFGLPLTFRYRSLAYRNDARGNPIPVPADFNGVSHQRSASPIHIRIVTIGDLCFPFFIRLDAPLLPTGENVRVKVGSRTDAIPVNTGTMLDNFCTTKLVPLAVKEVRW